MTPRPPKGSPFAESNPAEIKIKSGLNSFIIGNKILSNIYIYSLSPIIYLSSSF